MKENLKEGIELDKLIIFILKEAMEIMLNKIIIRIVD